MPLQAIEAAFLFGFANPFFQINYLYRTRQLDYEEGFNKIYADHKTNFMLYIAQLHNFAKKLDQNKIIKEIIEEYNKNKNETTL